MTEPQKKKPDELPSYHDVVVFVNGERYRIFDCSYGMRLQCTRAGGWSLWHIWNETETMIGGEYNGDDFRIEVRGVIVCQSSKRKGQRQTPGDIAHAVNAKEIESRRRGLKREGEGT